MPQIYIDPYGQRPYKATPSSKSIFKDRNLHSNLIRSINVNKLTNVFNNDTVISGLKLTNEYLSNNNRTFNFKLSPGRIIQDNTLIDILEPVNLSIDVFSEYNILTTNNSSNYFEVLGNQTNNFPTNKQFSIFNSNTTSFNHSNWVVQSSKYSPTGNKTRVYTIQSVTQNDVSGQIVNDNFPNSDDSIEGTIILASKYKFIETLDTNRVEFMPIYINKDNQYFPEFDKNTFRIIYSVIEIDKNLEDFKIVPDTYMKLGDMSTINCKGQLFYIRNMTEAFSDHLDGGVI